MCVATVIEKSTNIATSVLHQLSIKKAIICSCPVASYYDLEVWNHHVNGTAFESGLRS